MKEYRSIKLWLTTYRLLKMLAAASGETLAALLDRLAHQEKDSRSSNVAANVADTAKSDDLPHQDAE